MIKLIINKEKEEERMRGLYFTYGHILQTLQRFIPKEESQCSIILIYFLFMGKKDLAHCSQTLWWPPQIMPSPNGLPEEARPQDAQPMLSCTFTFLGSALQKALATACGEAKVALEALTRAQGWKVTVCKEVSGSKKHVT